MLALMLPLALALALPPACKRHMQTRAGCMLSPACTYECSGGRSGECLSVAAPS